MYKKTIIIPYENSFVSIFWAFTANVHPLTASYHILTMEQFKVSKLTGCVGLWGKGKGRTFHINIKRAQQELNPEPSCYKF